MEQPPAGITIQGLLRPALIEEHSDIQRHRSSNQYHDVDNSKNVVGNNQEDLHVINGHRNESEPSRNGSEESKKDDKPMNGTSFYKLEMTKIQPILAHAHQVLKCLFTYLAHERSVNCLSISVYIATC